MHDDHNNALLLHSDVSYCNPGKNCSEPQFNHTEVTMLTNTLYESMTIVVCTPGYQFPDSLVIEVNSTCTENGTWSVLPQKCQRKYSVT